jgi:hypothetical protein
MVAILDTGRCWLIQFWKGTTQWSFQQSLVEIGSVVSKKCYAVKSIFIYCYASNPDAAAWMLKFVFVYLANTTVLCYSLTIICCCQVQDYIYWIISTENDYSHHHKFIKYEKRLRKEGKNMLGLPIKQNLCHFSASLWKNYDCGRQYPFNYPFTIWLSGKHHFIDNKFIVL